MSRGSDRTGPPTDDRARKKRPGLLLGRPFGVPVYVTSSWWIVAILITLVYGGIVQSRLALGPSAYLLAFVFAILLYASVLVHELAHSVVARWYGLPVRRIVLYVLGGVSEIDREAPTPGREFWIAFSGPLLSLVLAAATFALTAFADPFSVTGELLFQLWVANLLVGVFNLLPGLPLDGGRLLGAGVWKLTGRRHTGSVVAAWGGRVLALVVVALPFLFAWSAGSTPGPWAVVWGVVLAGFMWMSASEALRNARIRARVPGLRARALARSAVTVPADLPLAQADRRAEEAGAAAVVVTDSGGTPISVLHPAAAEAITGARRDWVPVADVSRALTGHSTVAADLEGEELLQELTRSPLPEYLVLEADGTLLGVLRAVDVNAAMAGRTVEGAGDVAGEEGRG
ncbi:site-2 protease family protein [Nocardiopsis metallicus]|uniref:Zinc metalloprotease n=1 Tax=Nocardiopsis metallicus TaxID=179819 RepID=A0A840W0T9_9ACTN|nr:site-2 protease family protein [Nocardiopsis metallicus]MBB5489682.1 Zn-dependent protease [Nocardiopsis metallicus]